MAERVPTTKRMTCRLIRSHISDFTWAERPLWKQIGEMPVSSSRIKPPTHWARSASPTMMRTVCPRSSTRRTARCNSLNRSVQEACTRTRDGPWPLSASNSGSAQDIALSGMSDAVMPELSWPACLFGRTRGAVETEGRDWTSTTHPRALRSYNKSSRSGLRDDRRSPEGFFPRRARRARAFIEQGSRAASAARPCSVRS